MQDATTYHGWSNRETWLANLWLTNDQTLDSLLRVARRESHDSYDVAEYIVGQLHTQLEFEAEEAGLWQDLLLSAFNRINWVEVVENNL